MGTAEEDAREQFVKSIVEGSEKNFRTFVVTSYLDLKQNGCSKACGSWVDRWTPASVFAAIGTVIWGLMEYRKQSGQ